MHPWISFALPRFVKLLENTPGLSLMSVEIRLSEHALEFEANSVESSGGVATAERSGERKW